MKAEPDLDKFRFRDLHENVRIGTASDRYAGWTGQIYSEKPYAGRISKRSNTVAGKTFQEQVLPVDSVEEYFQHFPLLELDFTFYTFLLDKDSRPAQPYYVLRKYRDHIHETDRLILKVPQAICARKLRKGGELIENPDYLNSEVFPRRFYEPAQEILGNSMSALIFEEAYLPKKVRTSPDEHADGWDRFFQNIPKDNRYHVELRTVRKSEISSRCVASSSTTRTVFASCEVISAPWQAILHPGRMQSHAEPWAHSEDASRGQGRFSDK